MAFLQQIPETVHTSRNTKRNVFLFKHFLNTTIDVHDGEELLHFKVTEHLIHFCASSFILTRRFGVTHVPKKTKKQKEAESKKNQAKLKKSSKLKSKLGKTKGKIKKKTNKKNKNK